MIKQGTKSNRPTKSKITHTSSTSTHNKRLVHLAGFLGYFCILISETTLFTVIGSFLLSLFTNKSSNLLELSSTQTLVTPVMSAGDKYGNTTSVIVEFLVLSLLALLGVWILLKAVRLTAQLLNDIVATHAPKQHQFIVKSLLSATSLVLACLLLIISYGAAASHTLFISILTGVLVLIAAGSFYLEHLLLERYNINPLSIWR